jgi:hypothetical protein
MAAKNDSLLHGGFVSFSLQPEYAPSPRQDLPNLSANERLSGVEPITILESRKLRG